mgnify:CR=1 FL=1
MNKIGLIIRREYFTRVRKKTFILMSFLGPLVIVGFLAFTVYLNKNNNSSYKILEIDASATDSDVKKAYRKMAVKYHPDKVAHLGKEIQKTAEDKFKAVNDAYNEIKRQRNLR